MGVVNLSLSNFPFRYFKGQHKLINYSVLEITGSDSERFLQGQLTSDLIKLTVNSFQYTARVSREGRVIGFGWILKKENSYLFLIKNDLVKDFRESLEKFMIMDDVSIADSEDKSFWLSFSSPKNIENVFSGSIYGEKVYLSQKAFDIPIIEESDFLSFQVLANWPVYSLNVQKEQLLNETSLNSLAVSYDKGCFLGQETLAKIETRKGAGFSTMFLKTDSKLGFQSGEKFYFDDRKVGKILNVQETLEGRILQVSLLRSYRIIGKEYDFKTNDELFSAEIIEAPVSRGSDKEKSFDLFKEGVSLFKMEKDNEALVYFKRSIELDPLNADAIESLGVLLGRLNKYQEGIEMMDDLLKVDSDSIMAHTNKSLFYMKLGEIEKAEEEKAQATVKTFSMYGKKAKNDKEKEEEAKKVLAEIETREKMFQQVIEIDSDDIFANYGLAEIYYKKEKKLEAKEILLNVLNLDKNHSLSYLLLGKVLIDEKEHKQAKELLEKGISIASKKGEMMPANQMQALLNQL